MYSSWPCPTDDGGSCDEMVLRVDANRDARLLIAPPLFDEANKFRHQIFETMRKLDRRGIDCFCPDLSGCNESMAPLAEQTLGRWRSEIQSASMHFRTSHVLAIRSGCWLVPPDMPGWSFAPTKPRQVLRSLIRARLISSREAGRTETAEELLERGRTGGLDLAGWRLGPILIGELAETDYEPSDLHIVIDQADLGGTPLWLRAENDYDADQAEALAALVAAGMTEL